ncbi:alpha/beta hydrolase [Cellulomonas sp. HZM]|uniref:alpha/beta hydrolase n=1 Tax=Cellulomonas sp. HZM TaxID=1454010 RepID=UPI0004937BD4|nr:alpha/beta hydrolase [Cellulomonas sp. HZM]
MTTWGDGVRVSGGPGPTSVELDNLAAACRSLRAASHALGAAQAQLVAAAWGIAPSGTPAALGGMGGAQRVAVDEALRRARDRGPGVVGAAAEDAAVRLRRVVEAYDGAESTVTRLVDRLLDAGSRRVATLAAAADLGPVPVGSIALAAGGALAGAQLAAVSRVAGPGATAEVVGRASRAQVPQHLVGPLAALLQGAAGTADQPRTVLSDGTVGPFGTLTRQVGAIPTRAASTERVPEPAQLPAPRSTADVLRNVAASYPRAGAPPSTVSVQRLAHPDGSVAWVVEVPGTQSGSFGGGTATDMTTNTRLVAGIDDDMSDGVLAALDAAGARPDEPVLLAGHSQGGMVAMTVAARAAGRFDVRAVVTAGSPDVPRRIPAGVQVRSYRIDEDLVPQTDGRADVVNRDMVTVRRSIPARDVAHAHDVRGYVRTAELADEALAGSPAMRGFDAELARVLGPPGTTATTQQFSVTRGSSS